MRTVMKRLFLLATVLLATVAVAPSEEAGGQEKQPGQLSKSPSGSVVRPTPGRQIELVPSEEGRVQEKQPGQLSKPPSGIAVPKTKPPSRSVIPRTPVAVAGQCPFDCDAPRREDGELWCSRSGKCPAGVGCSCNLFAAPLKTTAWEKVGSQGDRITKDPMKTYRCWCTK